MKKILLLNIALGTIILSGCLSRPETNPAPATPVDQNTLQQPINEQPANQTGDLEQQTEQANVESQSDQAQPEVQPEAQPELPAVEPIKDEEMTAFTMEDIATHGIKESCWLVVEGYVYDVTDYVTKHPGGEAIVEGCGKEATELFNTRPMGSGTPHSQKAKDMLANFLIGKVKK